MNQVLRTSLLSMTALLTCLATHAEETIAPVDQAELAAAIKTKGPHAAFEEAFEAGDKLVEFSFTAAQGVGAHVGEGRRFSRLPRADLNGEREWAQHLPMREGGPNATSCIACHNKPIADGGGDVALNAVIDPAHTGDPRRFLERNTLHFFALAASQRLAEEMSLELYAQRDAIKARACETGDAKGPLTAKGVSFGSVSVKRTANPPCEVSFDWSRLEGIDDDLVVRAFGWKGNHATIRSFTRGAAHNELGLQAVEIIGDTDGDNDGVINELTVGDITALSVYMAALERPVSRLELADLGLISMDENERRQITRGSMAFKEAGCASCHTPEMELEDPVFREPSTTPGFHDTTFPCGEAAADYQLIPATAISFDMTEDQPNNRIPLANGNTHPLGSFPRTEDGGARIAWFTDFKRHDMGEGLADPDDPLGIGARMWPTRSLAGVGSTGPWLHDGRATTLEEAIAAHGGEAAKSRALFETLGVEDRAALIAYLENLVIYKHEGS